MRRLVLVVVAVAAVGVAVVVWGRGDRGGTVDAVRDAEVLTVGRRTLTNVVKATGVIRPMVGAEVRVGSRISGVVKRLFVRIGDRVSQGQLLAELDARDLEARRSEAGAALELAQANLTYARSDLARRRELAREGLLPPSDLDVAERACAIAEQQAKGATASLEYANAQLAYARISAPIGGVVASVSTQEGETVAASFAAPTFLTLLDLNRLEVWAYVDETDIGRITRGQTARFTVDTYGDQEFGGRVTDVYPRAEIRDNVVNYVTVVRFTPPRDRALRPEMTTAVRITTETRERVLALPLKALRREGGRTFVLCPRGATPERRWVTTGGRDDAYYEIVDGLNEGDAVLVGNVPVG